MTKIILAVMASMVFAAAGSATEAASGAQKPGVKTYTFSGVSDEKSLIEQVKATLSTRKAEIVDISSKDSASGKNDVTVTYRGNFAIARYVSEGYKNAEEARQDFNNVIQLFQNNEVSARIEGSSIIVDAQYASDENSDELFISKSADGWHTNSKPNTTKNTGQTRRECQPLYGGYCSAHYPCCYGHHCQLYYIGSREGTCR